MFRPKRHVKECKGEKSIPPNKRAVLGKCKYSNQEWVVLGLSLIYERRINRLTCTLYVTILSTDERKLQSYT